MNHRIVLLLTFFAATLSVQAQKDPASGTVPPTAKPMKRDYTLPDATPFAATITVADLRTLVQTLASAEMQGRETGEPGQQKAAAFIAKQFKAMGLPSRGDGSDYLQRIQLQNERWEKLRIEVAGQTLQDRTQFYVFPGFNSDLPHLELKEVVFVGYGIEDKNYSDYGKTDVRGKAVIFYDGEPLDESGKSLITGSEFRSNWSIDWKRKVQLAKQKGAVFAFVVDSKFAENVKANRKQMATYGWKPYSSDAEKQMQQFCNNIFISPEVAATILGKKSEKADEAVAAQRSGDKFKPVAVKTKVVIELDKSSEYLQGANVVGFIEGTDPKMKNEYVVVTAHYDHLGQVDSTIYYGADDNASGTAGVIEIAQAFAEAKKQGVGPKRSVVCILMSGEEKGLLGSKFYAEFPIFPMNKTVVDINIDMIGRVDDKHVADSNYVYVIGADRLSSQLQPIIEMVNNEQTKLALDYTFDAPNDPNHFYERSDHYNFAQQGVPVVFFFNGTHADYHRPSDTADKIRYGIQAKRAQLAFHVAWEIANRPIRLGADKKK